MRNCDASLADHLMAVLAISVVGYKAQETMLRELQIEIVQNGLSIPSRSLEKLPLSHFEVMTETVAKFAGIAVRLPILSVFSREWRSRGWANKRLY